MKFVKVSICAFVIAAIATTLLGNYTALAEWEGISYFEGDTSQVWPPDMFDGSNGEGRYSKKGSVMPSPNSYSYSESQRYARGAVGMEVLDSYPGANYKEKLFYFLRDKNLNGTPWEQAGSALIVHQMLGRDWGDGGRVIVSTSHDWVELENRLVHNSSLRMEFEYHSRSENTAGALTRFNRSGAYNRYDAFRYSLSAGTVPSIVFYDESTSPRTKVYAIEIWCANPLGHFSGLPDVQSYNLTPSLTTANTDPVGTTPLDNTSVARGSRITASGKVDNSGSSAGSKDWYVTMLTYAPGTNPATKSQRDTTTNGSNLCAEFVSTTDCAVTPRTDTFGENATRTASRPEFIVTNGVSVGTQFCFVVSVRNPTAATDAPMWRHSAMNCVVVEREYVLEPTIESVMGGVPDGSVVEPGASGPIRYTVENGGTDPSVPTEWRLTFYEYRPGSGSIDKSGKESTNQPPCEAFPGTGQPLVRAQCTSNPPQGWTGTDIIFNPGG